MKLHPADMIAPAMGEDVWVGLFCVLGCQPFANAANRRSVRLFGAGVIGDGTIVGHHCVVYAGVEIGVSCRLGDYASIREGTRVGERCVIGRGVDIQYGCVIGDDVRILNNTQIAGGTIIGHGSFIGPGVETANHAHVDLEDYRIPDGGLTPPIIGEKVMIGAGAIILPGVRIGDRATIAAGAVVTRDVPAGQTWMGAPARERSSHAKIDRLDMPGR